MNSENYWVVSLTAISYKIQEGIIKQVTCQLLEMVITRNHDAKLTLFFFKYCVLKNGKPKESYRCDSFDFRLVFINSLRLSLYPYRPYAEM